MQKSVRYESQQCTALIRESMRDPYGRSFLLLVYLDGTDDFSGFYLTPYSEHGDKTRFRSIQELSEKMTELVQMVLHRDVSGIFVNCCEEWIEEGLPEHADFVILFHLNKHSAWTGHLLSAKLKINCTFKSRERLLKRLENAAKNQRGGV